MEIEARIANAKAKAIEAGASADIVRALEAEIQAIRDNLHTGHGVDVLTAATGLDSLPSLDVGDDLGVAGIAPALTARAYLAAAGTVEDGHFLLLATC